MVEHEGAMATFIPDMIKFDFDLHLHLQNNWTRNNID